MACKDSQFFGKTAKLFNIPISILLNQVFCNCMLLSNLSFILFWSNFYYFLLEAKNSHTQSFIGKKCPFQTAF